MENMFTGKRSPRSLFRPRCFNVFVLVLVASGRNHKTLQSNTHVIRIYTYLQTYYLYTRYLSGIIPIGACWLLPSPPLPTTRKHRVVPATSQFRCTRKRRQQWGWLHHTTLPMVVDWRFPLAVFPNRANMGTHSAPLNPTNQRSDYIIVGHTVGCLCLSLAG